MGRRGPLPKPTALRRLEGNPAKRALPKDEPTPPVALPTAPRWLDAGARAEWRRLGKLLLAQHLVTEQDRTLFASHCDAWSRFCRANRNLAKSGEVVTVGGYQQKSAWLTVRDAAWKELEKTAQHFGLSPASRARLHVAAPEEPKVDPFQAFQQKLHRVK